MSGDAACLGLWCWCLEMLAAGVATYLRWSVNHLINTSRLSLSDTCVCVHGSGYSLWHCQQHSKLLLHCDRISFDFNHTGGSSKTMSLIQWPVGQLCGNLPARVVDNHYREHLCADYKSSVSIYNIIVHIKMFFYPVHLPSISSVRVVPSIIFSFPCFTHPPCLRRDAGTRVIMSISSKRGDYLQ